MSPVVHDQARALLEDLVAVAELADEVCLQAVVLRVEHLEALVAARWDRLEARVRLPLRHVLSDGDHVGARKHIATNRRLVLIIALVGHGHILGPEHWILVHVSEVHGLRPPHWSKERCLHVLGTKCMNGRLILLVKLCPEVLIRRSLKNRFTTLDGVQGSVPSVLCSGRPFENLELWSKLLHLSFFRIIDGVTARCELLWSRCYPLYGFF